MGIDPDKQLRFINYGDYGMDLYSNAIIVSKKLVEGKPEGGARASCARINQGVDRLAQGHRRPRSPRSPSASR